MKKLQPLLRASTVRGQDQASNHGFPQTEQVSEFIDVLIDLGPRIGLSLRDFQRAFIYLRVAGNFGNTWGICAYLIALKLKHPEIFSMLQKDIAQGSLMAEKLVGGFINEGPSFWLWEPLYTLHQLQARSFVNVTEVEKQKLSYLQHVFGIAGVVPRLVAKIDLPEISI